MALHTKQYMKTLVDCIKRALDSEEVAPDGRVVIVSGLRTEEAYDMVRQNFDPSKYCVKDELTINAGKDTLADSTRYTLYFTKKQS